jgi:hypothetical protein
MCLDLFDLAPLTVKILFFGFNGCHVLLDPANYLTGLDDPLISQVRSRPDLPGCLTGLASILLGPGQHFLEPLQALLKLVFPGIDALELRIAGLDDLLRQIRRQ